MYKKFEINQTKIKGGCQSGRKVVIQNSKSDLPLRLLQSSYILCSYLLPFDILSKNTYFGGEPHIFNGIYLDLLRLFSFVIQFIIILRLISNVPCHSVTSDFFCAYVVDLSHVEQRWSRSNKCRSVSPKK